MKNVNIEPVKGDILGLDKDDIPVNKLPHYIVYLEVYPSDTSMFIGAMLTHSDMSGNIPLLEDHFIKMDDNGKNFKISFDKSLVVNHPLFKRSDWLNYEVVGRLSQSGIDFIEDKIAPYELQFHIKI